MSSSNRVRIAYIKEATYGVTPGVGNFKTARMTSESLSGTPETVESQQIRTDRMSSGQITTGLAVEGDLAFELAKEAALEDFMESAMFNAWNVLAPTTVDLDIDATAKTITRDSGSFITNGIVPGDFLTLSGFTDDENNVRVMVAEVVSATVIRYVGEPTMITASGTGTAYARADKLSIGTTTKSLSMIKIFEDLTTRAINYKGMLASQMEINIAYGALVTGSFTFQGNGYEAVTAAADFISNGHTIDAPATTQTFNGSIDMPYIASDIAGDLEESDFCIQELTLSLNNNTVVKQCIGNIAPEGYTPGTAQIEISMNTYLKDDNWDLLSRKLTQDPFSLGFVVENSGGAYGFYLPAIQVSFDDPSAGGANQEISLEMSGFAKVGANQESALTIYRF